MPTNNDGLTLDDVLNFEVSAAPASAVADREAQYKKYEKKFSFDPDVSLASEIELQRQDEIEQIRKKAQANPKTNTFLNSSDTNARIGSADVDGLNDVADGLGNINGVKNLSFKSMEKNLVNINAKNIGGVFKALANDANQGIDLDRAVEKQSTLGKIKLYDPSKEPKSKIEPTKKEGNRYLNSVKRGSASIIQLGALIHDGLYEGFERIADASTDGINVNEAIPYKTNKVFNAFEALKKDKYAQSSQLLNLMSGSELAGKQAQESGDSPLAASMKYLIDNGSFGDAGEVLAEIIPSLFLGGGAGAGAEKAAAIAANKFISGAVGRSIASGSVINPTRLAAIEVLAPKAVQGSVMAGVTDFTSSFAPEIEAQKDKGYSDSDAVNRALKRSLAQAGVSAAGGSLLPLRFGGDFSTVVGQSSLQGLFGYGSGAAGAASIGEEYSSTEGALNILLGAVTALPEVIAVGGLSINKSEIKTQLDDFILERATADISQKQELEENRSIYFASSIRELLKRVKGSKTNDRSPETLRDFVKAIQDDPEATKEVYIDSEKFNQLAVEHNIDLASIFELAPELSRDYQRTNDIDGLIRVPLDELLTAFSGITNEEYLNAFADSLRMSPEAMTASDARIEFSKTSKDMESDIKEITETFQKEKVKQKELKTVADIIENDLNNLNFGFEKSTEYNKLSSGLVSAFYETLSDKTGIPVMQLYKSMPLRVVSTAEQSNAILGSNQPAIARDTDIAKLSESPDVDGSSIFTVGENGFSLAHGSPNKALSIDDVVIIRDGQKQAKKGREYGGFYATLQQDRLQAENYSKMNGSDGNVFDVNLKSGTKILKKNGDITRLSKQYIDEQVAKGVGAIYGTDPRGRTEIAIIDKNAIESIGDKSSSVDSFNQTYPDYLSGDLYELSEFYKKDDAYQFENGDLVDSTQKRIIEKLVDDDNFNGMFVQTSDGYASISKSSKEQGMWQATYFDSEYNPISDGGVYDKKTAITDFIESINPIYVDKKLSAVNPDRGANGLNKSEFQDYLKEKYSVDLGLTESKHNNQLAIEKIIVPDDARGSGTGTKAMDEIVSYADSNNKLLTLTPSADFGGSKTRLAEFYKRFGFVENKGKNKDYEISDSMYRPIQKVESFNQSNDPQVELRKIYGYRDSHLAPDADSGVSGLQITDAFSELNNRDFTKNYGDGFKYDAKTVKIIREIQKNPDGEVKVYRAVPSDLKVDSLNFGDWVGLTKDYADEHGKARFDGDYKVIEQTVKASDLYTDGNSIHEWGYSPKSSDIYAARLQLNEQLKKLNDRLDQGIFNSSLSKKDVLGDKSALKNNPAMAKMFLDFKGASIEAVANSSGISDAALAIAPELKSLEYNSDIKQNQDLLDRAFDALYLSDLRDAVDDPSASEFAKNRAFNKLIKFTDVANDQKFNLIDAKISKIKNAKDDGVNEAKTRDLAIDKAKSFDAEYNQFIDDVLRDLGLDYYNQKSIDGIRGQIQFRKDKKGAVIILGKDADFSTFAHELGHHFLEMSMNFAMRPDAPEQLKIDMAEVMRWSDQGKNLQDWSNLSADQKTEVHEKFAETFEQYMFTGKSPSNELRKVFARFRSFMAAVYSNIKNFLSTQKRAELNPEIRDIMDRMLATQEAIEQVQRQRNLELAITQEQAMQMGISPKDYLIMVDENKEATEQAINELEQKTLKDLARYRTLRNKHVKAFSEQQKRVRQQVREKVAEEVAAEPVYQALSFLRQPVERVEKAKRDPNKVDDAVDTLLEAVAKLGGINSKEIESTWGTDLPESYKVNVGRVKKIARKDGASIETVAAQLAEHGYLSTDEYGRYDTHEFENLFSDSLSGAKFYSRYADPELYMSAEDYGLATGYIEEFPDNGKLNLEWLEAKYGKDSEIYKAVGKTGQYGLAMKGGLDPDMVANNFGYDSADAMIQEMAKALPPKDIIEERANGLIQAKHADLFDSQAMEMAIDEAVHNDLRAMMLSRELSAITKLKGRESEFNSTAKAMAQNIIDNSIITEIRPHLFSAAELRQSKAFDKALKSGNTMDSVRAKRQQLINFHAAKQAYEANRFIDKLIDLTKTINGNDAKIAKARDFNLVTLARYVASVYGLTNVDVSVTEQMKAIKEYDPITFSEMVELVGFSDDGAFSPKLEVKNYKEMTYIEFNQLNDMLRQVWHRSKEAQKVRVGNEKIELSIVTDNLASAAYKKPAKSRNAPLLGYKPNHSGFNPRRSLQTLKRAEQFFNWLDDSKVTGYFHRYVFNPMQDALSSYRLEQKKMMQSVVDIYSEFAVVQGKIDASELGGSKNTFDSKHELLHAILHTGNESNKKRLVLGYGWGEKSPDGAIDYSKWNSFISRMFDDGVIVKQDMDAIQKIWNLFDGYKAQAQEVHKRINGLYFKELPKNKIVTPFGEYEGGYIPADYDKNADVNAELLGQKNEASTQGQGLHGVGISTGANFTKSRVDNFDGFGLILDLTKLPSHLDRELRYIHLEENLKQASKIFRNKDVLSGIESASPFATTEIIQDWLGAIADQKVSKSSKFTNFDNAVEKLKQNSGIVLMAGNIKNAVEAWTSIPQLMTAVPKMELASSTAKYFKDAFSRESMTTQVRNLSPFMDTRLDNVANEMRFQIDKIVANPSKAKQGADFLRNNAYVVQQVAQVPLETIGWMAAFNDAQTKGNTEADAIHHADGIMRQYLNDMTPEGISKIERSHPLMRAMLMFYGWFNMVHNTWAMRNKLISEDITTSKARKMGQYAGLYTMMIAMPAMLSKALTLSFNGELFNNEDSDDWQDDIVNIVVQSQVEMLMGMLPFARDVLNPIYRTTVDATIYSDRYSVSPIVSMGENLLKAGKTAGKIGQNVFGADNEIDASKTAKEMLQAATFATGIPFTLIQRPVSYGADVLIDEDQEPKNIADAVRGTVNGR